MIIDNFSILPTPSTTISKSEHHHSTSLSHAHPFSPWASCNFGPESSDFCGTSRLSFVNSSTGLVHYQAVGQGWLLMDMLCLASIMKAMGARCYIKRFDNIVDCSDHFKSICGQEEYRGKRRFLYWESMGGAVSLLRHKKDHAFWHDIVLIAPMCKITVDKIAMKSLEEREEVITQAAEMADVFLKSGKDTLIMTSRQLITGKCLIRLGSMLLEQGFLVAL